MCVSVDISDLVCVNVSQDVCLSVMCVSNNHTDPGSRQQQALTEGVPNDPVGQNRPGANHDPAPRAEQQRPTDVVPGANDSSRK